MSRFNSSRSAAAVAAILLLLLAAAAWIGRSRSTARLVTREAGLNVLLITIDTLRADAVGAYGQPGAVTPSIDRLASAGVRFTRAHAHNVVTLPSHANILSGRLPPEHGVRDNSGFRFPADLETMATVLAAQGYRTGAFVSAFPLESRFGLDRGFEVYDDRFADAARPAFLVQERPGSETVANARRWIASLGEQRWFCWVHVYEPHFPYAAPGSIASRFPSNPYIGEVSAADAALAPLLDPIVSAGRSSRTLVVLTSDHGEALGDHGEATHGVFAYEAVLKVPLILYQPRVFAAAVLDTPARHVDLLPTVLDAAMVAVPAGVSGHSLLPAIGSNEATARRDGATYFEALSASLNRQWAPLAGVIHDNAKFIELPIPELYDLSKDPGEQHNLADSRPERVQELRALVRELRGTAGLAARDPESADTRARLRSLGYAASGGAGTARRFTEADDPKRLIELDEVLQEVVQLYVDGNLRAALARCRELVARRPDMPLALLQLAHLERESGNLPNGIDTLRKAVSIAPGNTEAVALLGAYLTQAGRAAEAIRLLEPYTRRDTPDIDIMTAHALALAQVGRGADAVAALARGRKQDPTNAKLLVDMGTVHMMAGDPQAARAAFLEALAINPALARAHSSLAALEIDQGRREAAIAHWRSAVALDAREFDTVLAVGLSLARSKRGAEARTALEFFIANAPARYADEVARARTLLPGLPPHRN